jgi:nitroreductase
MEIIAAMRERRSIRAFLPNGVPDQTVTAILDEARWAPSWGNAQDWRVFVVTGEALAKVKAGLADVAGSEAPPAPDLPWPAAQWPDYLASRMTYRRPAPGAAPAPPQRPGLTDVYGAPVLLLLAADERLSPAYSSYDAGLLTENICLAATAHELGTCIMAMLVRYPDVLRAVVPAEGLRFVIAVALGYADVDSDLNEMKRERVDLDEIVTWVK